MHEYLKGPICAALNRITNFSSRSLSLEVILLTESFTGGEGDEIYLHVRTVKSFC